MLEGDYSFENEPDTKHRLNTRFDSDSSDAELSAITSVALTCLDESRGVLTSFNQKVGSAATSEDVGQVQRTVERVILQIRKVSFIFQGKGGESVVQEGVP
jgi:hypothetical protein